MRILLVDDHSVVRQGLRRLLSDEFAGTEFGESASGSEGSLLAANEEWDLVILDLNLPGRSGLEALQEIRDRKPALPILVVTMHPEDQYAIRALRSGASGYLNKACEPEILFEAVRKVIAGGKYLTPSVAEQLATTLQDSGKPLHEQLSDREFQVLRLLGAGKTVKQIADELHLSEKTISTYRVRMLEKLNLTTTASLVHYAIVHRLVD